MFASGKAAAPASPVWKRRGCRIRRRKCRRSCRLSGRNSAISWGRRKSSSQQRSAKYGKSRQQLSMSVFSFLYRGLCLQQTFSALSKQIYKPEARVRSHPSLKILNHLNVLFFCVCVYFPIWDPSVSFGVEMGELGCDHNRKPLLINRYDGLSATGATSSLKEV